LRGLDYAPPTPHLPSWPFTAGKSTYPSRFSSHNSLFYASEWEAPTWAWWVPTIAYMGHSWLCICLFLLLDWKIPVHLWTPNDWHSRST
jgi:hypothetical protein